MKHVWKLLLSIFSCFCIKTIQSSIIFDALGHHSVTFAGKNSFIELRPNWPLWQPREVKFKFRTLLPHALLLYHSAVNSEGPAANYEVLLQLENARLKFIHIFGGEHETLCIGRALNSDSWHSVELLINPVSATVRIKLNDELEEATLNSLKNMSSYLKKFTAESSIFFGGLDQVWNRQLRYTRFVGCIGEVVFKVNSTLVPQALSTNYAQIKDTCVDKCHYPFGVCRFGGKCVNFYDRIACDCFGSKHKGSSCSDDSLTSLTLRGYSYLTYKVYDWDDKVHSAHTRISVTFRTMFDNSILFYGSGENPERNYISATLKSGSIHFTVNFGHGDLHAHLGGKLLNDEWNTFTVTQSERKIVLTLNYHFKKLDIIGPSYYLHLDPLFYIGGVPERKPGLNTTNNFVGSLKNVYFNIISVLELLKDNESLVTFHDDFPPEYGYHKVDTIPLTFPFKKSMIIIKQSATDSLNIRLEVKTNLSNTVVASAETIEGFKGWWQLKIENGFATFLFTPNGNGTSYSVIDRSVFFNDSKWHKMQVEYIGNEVQLITDFGSPAKSKFIAHVRFGRNIYVGGIPKLSNLGFIGCIRRLFVENSFVDVRDVLNSDLNFESEVTMDNCQLINPCKRPGYCEHGGICNVVDQKVTCNCTGTGYMGKTCHFSMYKRTCEELYLVGYREQGVYMIDIDGNGPHPPAPVTCEINQSSGVIITKVEHNMDRSEDVRGHDIDNFYFKISYRDFTPSMLQTLITHSKNCTQLILYMCHKAPLGMRTYTWFKSSYGDKNLYSLGGDMVGSCPCGESRTCDNNTKLCNCDVNDGAWRNDTVYFHDPKFLGITHMYFLRPTVLAHDSIGSIELGPLRCVEMDTQQYVITFRTSDSYLEVPGWRTGDLAFSFRTSNSDAILLYQQSHQPVQQNYFRVLLVNETELIFEYTVEGKRQRLQISSHKPLNSGEWQQVWVDYDPHHVRFTINMDSKMIDLEKDEEFSPFDGPLYLAGAPPQLLGESPVSAGFVGCFRGLVMNEEIVNIYYYLSSRTPQVLEGCKPSCHPNPCKNNATCHESWGSFECECVNKLAHFGKLCEKNLNSNGITFVTGTANSIRLFEGDDPSMPKFLTEDILLNIRTYAHNGLIFYAYDHYNNFVQLHIQNGDQLAFTFNSQRELMRGIVQFPELTRGQPVQILINREANNTKLYANDHVKVIDQPLFLIDKYRQHPWREGEDLEIIKPPRPPMESKPFLQYFIGGVTQDSMETDMVGFVGCIRGLRVGNRTFNLDGIVARNPGNKAFRKGCLMQCDTQPCHNNGYCIEDWKNQQRTCNCTFTSYIGRSCDEERSGTFDGQTLIKYKFFPSSIYLTVELKIAFVTAETPANSSILLFVNSKVDERNYIVITLLPDGRLKFEEDDGTGKVIQLEVENEGGTFGDSHRHWVYYVRHDDHINIYIDGVAYEPNITIFDHIVSESDPSVFGGDDRDVVILGGIDFKDNRFIGHINFTGCLSTVIVKIDDFTISPLETAFGYNEGKERLGVEGQLSQVKVCPSKSFNPNDMTTTSPINLTLYAGPKWKPPKLTRESFMVLPAPSHDFEFAEATTKRVCLAMGIFLIIILMSLGIYLWRVDWKDKQYRYEEGNLDGYTIRSKKIRSSVPDGNVKGVSFFRKQNSARVSYPESIPLRYTSTPPLIKRSSSQELEWDHSVDLIPKDIMTSYSEPTESENEKLEEPPPKPPRSDVKIASSPCPRLPPARIISDQYRSYDRPICYLGYPSSQYTNYVNNRSSLVSLD